MPDVQVVTETAYTSLSSIRYLEEVRDRGYAFELYKNWQTEQSLDQIASHTFPNAYQSWDAHTLQITYRSVDGGCVVHIDAGNGGAVSARVSSFSQRRIDEEVDHLQRLITLAPETEDGTVRVNFWWLSPMGPRQVNRRLVVPAWKDIELNYAASTREGLRGLFNGFTPDTGGKLILWSGVAGSGKTYALRALAKEWSSWCKLHYIIDTDKFFKDEAAYLVNVLLKEGEDVPPPSVGSTRASLDSQPEQWRLLVFEDAGELLTRDAKERVGQGLSRLLNVCDGLVGQGLRVLLLITTNEEIGNLHPAVVRPGRCTARIEFGAFGTGEAREWLERHLEDVPLNPGTMTLADLYAFVEGRQPRRVPTSNIGFVYSSDSA